MSTANQQAARAFAFTGATLLLGVVIFFFTQGLIPFVELPDIAGSVFALGFFLIYMNLSFALGRRFCSRSFELEHFPYIIGIILILPMLILSVLTDRFSGWSPYFFFSFIIIVAVISGAYLGINSGRRKRDRLIREALETGETGEKEV